MTDSEALRFFVDETDLGLGRALAAARRDVVHPGHRRVPDIPLGTKDPVWIPVVARMGLVLITRDKNIRRRNPERRLLEEHGLRAVFLTGAKALSTWGTLVLVVRQWDRLEEFIAGAPPSTWSASLSASGGIELITPGR